MKIYRTCSRWSAHADARGDPDGHRALPPFPQAGADEPRRLDQGPHRHLHDRAAERRGDIRPGDLLVEATAGNTGIGLALAAAQKGYHLVLVLPDKMSQEKIFNLRAMGAEIVLTRSDVGKGHPEYYQDLAQRIARERGGYYINQFGNPDNPLAHEQTTGAGDLGADGGGRGRHRGRRRLQRHHLGHDEVFPRGRAAARVRAGRPQGLHPRQLHPTGEIVPGGSWLVEGIGEDFIPDICDLSMVGSAYTVSDAESFSAARELLRQEGILAGSSSGTLLAAALRYCREQTAPKRVVAFACDTGNKYLSKLYNDFWMEDQGFIQREEHGDLRDLIGRPHEHRATITVGADDVITTAHNRLRNAGFSQLPVMEDDRLVGRDHRGRHHPLHFRPAGADGRAGASRDAHQLPEGGQGHLARQPGRAAARRFLRRRDRAGRAALPRA
jgi:cystathionine beta-synthase